MNRNYPFYFISDFFYEFEEEIFNLKKPSFDLSFPEQPKIDRFWEYVFGISKSKFLKYENDKINFRLQKDLFEKQLDDYKINLRKEIENYNKINKDEVKKKYDIFFKMNLDLKFVDINLKTGIGEKTFRNELIEEFGNKILINKKIIKLIYHKPDPFELLFDPDTPMHVEEEELGNPDFLLIINHLDLRIIINIEIDEPYILENGEVIHYIIDGDELDSYINYKRDLRFNDNGIIVLRFSEEQIVKYPKIVIKDIKLLLSKILNYEFPFHFIDFKVPISKRWTKNEAKDLSNCNFRNTYLPNNIIPLSTDNGITIKEEELLGSWYEDNVGRILIFYFDSNENDMKKMLYVNLINKNSNSKEEVSYTGSVTIKKDKLMIVFTKRNDTSLGLLKCFISILQIQKLTNEKLVYIHKAKIHNTRKIS